MSHKQNPAVVAGQLAKLTRLRPSLAFVLGSGFQGLASALRATAEIGYGDLPGFTVPSVPGHAGKLSVGYLGPAPVLILNGRSHYYEGHDMETITFPVRVLAAFGIKDLLLTNAAGGIHSRLHAGDFMLVTDHLNFMGANPLRGFGRGGEAFVDLTCVYDLRLRELLKLAAAAKKVALRTGVYAAVSGPCYETPAEVRAFRQLGADAVGMSTVPEAIVARQCGLNVAALSAITNAAAGRNKRPLNHEEVLAAGRQMQSKLVEILLEFVELYASNRR
jgi:purine-nucleoside phosphorylase